MNSILREHRRRLEAAKMLLSRQWPDKAKMYAQGYAGKPAVQALIKKASAK
ncbi:MAG TPA: hypothetical protein VF348_00380 [Usitatibacter sp.]